MPDRDLLSFVADSEPMRAHRVLSWGAAAVLTLSACSRDHRAVAPPTPVVPSVPSVPVTPVRVLDAGVVAVVLRAAPVDAGTPDVTVAPVAMPPRADAVAFLTAFRAAAYHIATPDERHDLAAIPLTPVAPDYATFLFAFTASVLGHVGAVGAYSAWGMERLNLDVLPPLRSLHDMGAMRARLARVSALGMAIENDPQSMGGLEDADGQANAIQGEMGAALDALTHLIHALPNGGRGVHPVVLPLRPAGAVVDGGVVVWDGGFFDPTEGANDDSPERSTRISALVDPSGPEDIVFAQSMLRMLAYLANDRANLVRSVTEILTDVTTLPPATNVVDGGTP